MPRFYHVARPRFGHLVARLALVVALVVAFCLTRSAAFADESAHDAPSPAESSAVAVPAPSPSAASSSSSPGTSAAAPSSSASAASAASGEIKVRDKIVFVVRAPRAGRSPADRARAANGAIDALIAHPENIGETRFEETQGTAVVFVGKTPVVTLGPEDVETTGEATLNVLGAQVTARLGDAMSTERKRGAIATTVFSFSLLVFSALLAFLALGRASELAARIRVWVDENPERVTGLHLGKIQFVSAGSARGALSIVVTLGYRFVQIAIAYGWLIFGLSLFDATRGYTPRLTGMVLAPLSGLASRIAAALPLVVVAGIGVFAVSVLVRFVGLFFDSVVRGETQLAWLSRDLARPTSVLVRAGIILVSLVVATPLITGSDDGAFSRVGLVALAALGFAATPLLASAAVGAVVVFGRRLRKGDLVEFGGRSGRVVDIRLLDVRLEDPGACEVNVPHLLGLIHPTRIHRHPPLISIDITVDAAASQAEVERILLEAGREISSRARVELVSMSANGVHWRVTSASSRGEATLGRVVQAALEKHGVALGGGARGPVALGSNGASKANPEAGEPSTSAGREAGP